MIWFQNFGSVNAIDVDSIRIRCASGECEFNSYSNRRKCGRTFRRLSDAIESHIHGLRTLGVPTESYGGILTFVLVNKLPSHIKLIINRALSAGQWELKEVLDILDKEVEAREQATSLSKSNTRIPPRKTPTRLPHRYLTP